MSSSSFKVLKCPFIWNSVLVAVLLFALFTVPTLGEDDESGDGEEEPEVQKICQQYVIELVLNIIPPIPKCLFGPNKLKFKLQHIFEALPRFYCVIKCVMVELDVFTEDGVIDEVGALLWFQSSFPEYAIEPITVAAQPCLSLSSKFKPKEYFCQSYSPFFQCMTGVGVTGIGPYILECFGTPTVGAFFGVMNFFVPPVRPGSGGEGRRRRIIAGQRNMTKMNTNMGFNMVALANILFSPQLLSRVRAGGNFTTNSRVVQRRKVLRRNGLNSAGSSGNSIAPKSFMNSFLNGQKSNSSSLNNNMSISSAVLFQRFATFANTFFQRFSNSVFPRSSNFNNKNISSRLSIK